MYLEESICFLTKQHLFPVVRVVLLTFIVSVSVCSCARFTPFPRTEKDAQVPEAFILYEERTPAPDRWWTAFGSEELDSLIARALEGNLTLKQIAARLKQAEMLARQADAARLPNLNASGDISATRRRMTTDVSVDSLDAANQQLGALNTLLGSGSSGSNTVAGDIRSAQSQLQAAETLLADTSDSSVTTVTHSYKFGLSSAYEVDLWGKVYSRRQAAQLDFEASREDMYAAMLSLSGTVARQWLEVVASRHELHLVQEQLKLNKTSLELIELRFRNGLATALDVYQQRQVVAQTESLIPSLEESLQAAKFELAVLLGKAPGETLQIAADIIPEIGALPDPGLPADLLARRPDIRAAGLQLQAADWRVAIAKTDRLPALQLNASASYGAGEWGLLFDNWMATLAGGVTGPIFDAGRRKAEVRRTQAVVEERLAAYRQKVLESVKEVEASMMRETKQQEYIQALEHEQKTAQATYDQALERYKKGIINYLPALTALTQLQTIERRLLQARQIRLERRIQLYIALGGGWMEEETGLPEETE